ncbi:MAG: hypothetical protein EHM17_11100 [Verrucomicrobiaceae bacterium]|nr:MAG: hypothetical protein EHM17_11100 [Verrucomicrobiaceae bacterium]
MNASALVFFLLCAVVLLVVPRRWAPVPLLVGCCYMTMGQGIEIGAFSLPIYRMLLFVGLIRMLLKGEKIEGFGNTTDKLVFFLMGWIFLASFFHDGELGSGPVYALGVIFNFALVYFLIRAWCRDVPEVVGVIVIIAFMLAPIAVEMVMERVTKTNLFAVFGGVPHEVMFREGKYRAQGPFRHSILAGTVGAVCIPLFIGIWHKNRMASIIGLVSGFCIAIASASSGPLMSMIVSICAVIMWRYRHLTNQARWTALVLYFAFQIYTGQPGYYLLSRIDLTGSSTGWHRARLIESAFQFIDEWWLFGTDVTRHWMPTGVSFSPYHADITNYYLAFGVVAGLPAMLVVIAILVICFRWIGRTTRLLEDAEKQEAFVVWCLGAGLFAHAATSISVSYFDQSLVFFWMNVAIISSMHAALKTRDPELTNEEQTLERDGAAA